DLPWRRTTDPYAIWVSEIMLQQTQVKTVIPYWERWMGALPDIAALARAKPDQLHKLWEGLGYYTRVRNLQQAAQAILAEHGGKFPDQFESVLALRGIGRYTAGAICSIAFNQPKPIVDGNVIRVLTRVFGVEGNPRDKAVNATLWQLAGQLVQQAAELGERAPHRGARTCSHLNQALMELGALLCTPRQPQCAVCPMAGACQAFQQGRTEELPHLERRVPSTARRFVALVVSQGDRFLVRQRPAGVVNGHLWEFPNVEVTQPGADVKQTARSLLGVTPRKWEPLCTIKHTITRYRITLEVFRMAGLRPGVTAKGQWLSLSELRQLAFTSANKKILQRLAAE
ncbi:MAG TPA: A/G-specific adenine glycosylase, partial [Candidatus Sulfotelmatobacter sp.]|nr:A/G-specific adenine glycosylase [Candidatus Sulfotelmatobacter sp.]